MTGRNEDRANIARIYREYRNIYRNLPTVEARRQFLADHPDLFADFNLEQKFSPDDDPRRMPPVPNRQVKPQ